MIPKEIPVVIGTKGVDKSGCFPYQIAKNSLKNPILVMSGPTFAQDMCSRQKLKLNHLNSLEKKVSLLFHKSDKVNHKFHDKKKGESAATSFNLWNCESKPKGGRFYDVIKKFYSLNLLRQKRLSLIQRMLELER